MLKRKYKQMLQDSIECLLCEHEEAVVAAMRNVYWLSKEDCFFKIYM